MQLKLKTRNGTIQHAKIWLTPHQKLRYKHYYSDEGWLEQ